MNKIIRRDNKYGEPRFTVQIRFRGVIKSKTFGDREEAEKWRTEIELAIRKGIHKPTPKHDVKDAPETVAGLIDKYTLEVLPRKPEVYATHLKWWRAQIGDVPITEIATPMISQCRDRLLNIPKANGAPRSPATVNRHLGTLSNVFTVAVREWEVTTDNPVKRVDRLSENLPIERFLDEDERTRLLAACRNSKNPILYTIVVLALATGARKNELLSLTWDAIDFKQRRITFHKTKTKNRRSCTVTGHPLELLRSLYEYRRPNTNLVFPGRYRPGAETRPTNFRTAWETALREASIHDFRFHDLRHTTASYLLMRGATLAEVGEVLGHTSPTTTKRYAHLAESHVSRLVEDLSKNLFGGSDGS